MLKSGWTGLMYACDGGHDAVVKLLLSYGANPNYIEGMKHIFSEYATHHIIIIYKYCQFNNEVPNYNNYKYSLL